MVPLQLTDLSVGLLVWVPDATEAWKAGEVLSTDPLEIRVDGVAITWTAPANAPAQLRLRGTREICTKKDQYVGQQGSEITTNLRDLADGLHLHEAQVLQALQQRYFQDHIYTWIGSRVLIALNPYKDLPNVYGEDILREMVMLSTKKGHSMEVNAKPHCYSLALNAYYEMTVKKSSQSILISGDTGSGKTETIKNLLHTFGYIDRHHSLPRSSVFDCENVFESCDNVLEAFGNAGTSKNSNSSRYGRLLELKYSANNLLQAASNETYLLEKSRVNELSPGERNFHIFYQMLAGLAGNTINNTDNTGTHNTGTHNTGTHNTGTHNTGSHYRIQDRSALIKYNFPQFISQDEIHFKHLFDYQFENPFAIINSIEDIGILSKGGRLQIEKSNTTPLRTGSSYQSSRDSTNSVDDAANFERTLKSMSEMGLSKEEQESIFDILSVIIYLSLIQFEDDPARSTMVISPESGRPLDGKTLTDAILREGNPNGPISMGIQQTGKDHPVLVVQAGGPPSKKPKKPAAGGGNHTLVSRIVDILGVKWEDLEGRLTTKFVRVQNDLMAKAFEKESSCQNATKALIRFLYLLVWKFISEKIDVALKSNPTMNIASSQTVINKAHVQGISSAQATTVKNSISILDMYGFECLRRNGFEQLQTNYMNEMLQEFINRHVQAEEESLYRMEGVFEDLKNMNTNSQGPSRAHSIMMNAFGAHESGGDTSEIVSLIEAPQSSIFSILDDESRKGSDQTFGSKLKAAFGAGKHPRFLEVKNEELSFAIRHFAGEVPYASKGWINKNSDLISVDIRRLLQKCGNKFITMGLNKYFTISGATTTDGQRTTEGRTTDGQRTDGGYSQIMRNLSPSISAEFSKSLRELLSKLDKAEPHFIRCIKPNTRFQNDLFQRMVVNEQLKFCGLYQVARMQRTGYSCKLSHYEFVNTFKVLNLRGDLHKSITFQEALQECKKLVIWICSVEPHIDKEFTKKGIKPESQVAIGKNSIFMTQEFYVTLERAITTLHLDNQSQVSAVWRMTQTKRRYRHIIRSIKVIQNSYRRYRGMKMQVKFRSLIDLLRARYNKQPLIKKDRLGSTYYMPSNNNIGPPTSLIRTGGGLLVVPNFEKDDELVVKGNDISKIDLKAAVIAKMSNPNVDIKKEFLKQRTNLVQKQVDLMHKIEKLNAEDDKLKYSGTNPQRPHYHIEIDSFKEDNYLDEYYKGFVKHEKGLEEALKNLKDTLLSTTNGENPNDNNNNVIIHNNTGEKKGGEKVNNNSGRKVNINNFSAIYETLELEIAKALADEKAHLDELHEMKKTQQYILEKMQIDTAKKLENQKGLALKVARKKLQEVADACVTEAMKSVNQARLMGVCPTCTQKWTPPQNNTTETVDETIGGETVSVANSIAKKAREFLSNIDLDLHIAQLEEELSSGMDKVQSSSSSGKNNDPMSGDTLTKIQENDMFRDLNFSKLDAMWNPEAIKNLRNNKKPVDILIIGDSNTGKTELIKKMHRQLDIPLPEIYLDPKTGVEYLKEQPELGLKKLTTEDILNKTSMPDIVRIDVPMGGGFNLRLLDVSNNLADSSIYRKLYHQCHWVFIVYTVTRANTVRRALSLLREAREFNNNVLLLGSLLYEAETVKANLINGAFQNANNNTANNNNNKFNLARFGADGKIENREININFVKTKMRDVCEDAGVVIETNDLLSACKLACNSMMSKQEEMHYGGLKKFCQFSNPAAILKEFSESTDDDNRPKTNNTNTIISQAVLEKQKSDLSINQKSVVGHEVNSNCSQYRIAKEYNYDFLEKTPPLEDIAHIAILKKAGVMDHSSGYNNINPTRRGGTVISSDKRKTVSDNSIHRDNEDYDEIMEEDGTVRETDLDAMDSNCLVLIEKIRNKHILSSVTCIAFGAENHVLPYTILAVGFRDGHLSLHRIHHTITDYDNIHNDTKNDNVAETTEYVQLVRHMRKECLERPEFESIIEREMDNSRAIYKDSNKKKDSNREKVPGRVEHICSWKGHQKAITGLKFSPIENHLITTSTDKTIKVWSLMPRHHHYLHRGHPKIEEIFDDSYPISCITTIISYPQLFVIGNSCGIIKICDFVVGKILQKLSYKEEIRTLCSDTRTGNYIFGGTKFGEIVIIDIENPLNFKFLNYLSIRTNASWKAITDINYGALANNKSILGWDDMLCCSCADNSIITLRINYELETNLINSICIMHRYPNIHSILPLHSIFSNHGFIISCSEDAHVHVHTIRDPQHVCSILHDSPVLAVDINKSHTILCTGDINGSIYIWRNYQKTEINKRQRNSLIAMDHEYKLQIKKREPNNIINVNAVHASSRTERTTTERTTLITSNITSQVGTSSQVVGNHASNQVGVNASSQVVNASTNIQQGRTSIAEARAEAQRRVSQQQQVSESQDSF